MITLGKMEVNITRQCVNRCVSCNHASPWAETYFMEPKVLARDLEMLGDILTTDLLCLQGGEPLLHPGIEELLAVSADAGIMNKLAILSNGKLLNTMPESFWKTCAKYAVQVRVTVYPNLKLSTLTEATQKAESYGVQIISGGFIWQKVLKPPGPPIHYDACAWKVCYTVHEGYFYCCPLTTFFPARFMGLEPTVDGVSLENITENKLQAYIDKRGPFRACEVCMGTSGPFLPWHECESYEQWLKESTHE